MKKIFVMFALMTGAVSAFAQNAADSISAETGRVTMTRELYPGQEDGDLYHGLTRKLTFDRMVPPYGLEVTYDKTTHIILPSAMWTSVPRILWRERPTVRRMLSA